MLRPETRLRRLASEYDDHDAGLAILIDLLARLRREQRRTQARLERLACELERTSQGKESGQPEKPAA